jgi:uncharacterized membrane protein YqjE
MAIVQALLALVSRSLGRVLTAAFGWAVVALFGQTSGGEKVALSALVGAAALWPVLLAGIAFPRVATFVLTFVPLRDSVPTSVIRWVWVVLAVAVPFGVGLTMAARRPVGGSAAVGPAAGGHADPREGAESRLARLGRGIPVTVALATSFLIVFVTVPARRLSGAVRRLVEVHVPLITDASAYDMVAAEIERTLRRHGFGVARVAPAWWITVPSRILLRLGGPGFREYVPDRLLYLAGPRLEAVLYPNGLYLRGPAHDTAWAHGVVVEALSAAPALQTFDPAAQDIEKQIRSVWDVYRQNPVAHRESRVLKTRVVEITRAVRELPVDYDEWQIVYRQTLQLGRAIEGDGQLLDEASRRDARTTDEGLEETAMATVTRNDEYLRAQSLSTRKLIGEITDKASLLVKKEVELAKTEIRADLEAQAAVARGLAAAIVAGLTALNMFMVAVVLWLATQMPGWLAAVIVAAVLLVMAAILGYVSWSRRLTNPLALTRKTLKEDVRWAKERLA